MSDQAPTTIVPAEYSKEHLEAAKRLHAYFMYIKLNYIFNQLCTIELMKHIGVPVSLEHPQSPASTVSFSINAVVSHDPVQSMNDFVDCYPSILLIATLIPSAVNGGSLVLYYEKMWDDCEIIGAAWHHRLNTRLNGEM